MRLTTLFLGIALVALPSMAMAQVSPQTCEEREILLREIITQDGQMRRNVEIELAATKVQIRLIKEQADAKVKTEVKEKK